MKLTAEPRSDQWNAEDFIQGPRTFRIANVIPGAAEQKYDIQLEGEKRVWRPPLTVLRTLMACWKSDESADWIGKLVTLYCDDRVTFGKDTTGGIRVSHVSGISKPVAVNVSERRGRRKIVTVQPLPDVPAPTTIPPDVEQNIAKAIQDGNLPAYRDWLTEQGAADHIIQHVNNKIEEGQ